MNDAMQMNPPVHGDPVGVAIIVVGTLLTLWALQAFVWVGERSSPPS